MAQLFTIPRQYAQNSTGRPLAGAKLYFYETETTNDKAVYQDSELTVPHPQPVQASAYGVFPAIYLDTSAGDYRVTLANSAGVLQWTQDGVGTGIITSGGGGGTSSGGYPQTDEELALGITPTDTSYPPGNVLRYGAVANAASNLATPAVVSGTDSAPAFQAAARLFNHYDIIVPPGPYLLKSRWVVTVPELRQSTIWASGAELFTGTTLKNVTNAPSMVPYTFTVANHGLTVGDRVAFYNFPTAQSFINSKTYKVNTVIDANTFTILLSAGGTVAYAGGGIVDTTGAMAALELYGKSTPHGCSVYGLKVNHRSNNTAYCGVLVNGTDHATLNNCTVEANGNNTEYAAFRLQQSLESDANTGPFWTTFNQCSVRERAGADPGTIPFGYYLYGACNATTIRGGSIAAVVTGVHIQYNAFAGSYIANAVLIDGVAFESIPGYGINMQYAADKPIRGLRVVNSRFENVTIVLNLPGSISSQPPNPPFLAGNYFTEQYGVTYINNPFNIDVITLDSVNSGVPNVFPRITTGQGVVVQATIGTAHGLTVIPGGGNRGISVTNNGGSQVAKLVWSGSGTGSILDGTSADLQLSNISSIWFGSPGAVGFLSGNGAPEGAVVAAVGSLYTNQSGGAGTTLYVKESGSGNTGWIAMATDT